MLRIFSIRALRMATRLGRRSAPALLLALSGLSALSARAAEPQPHTHLRIVGGLAGVHQFTRHEEPFWTRDLLRLSGGRASAEIVSFDRAGIRGQEMLRLVSLGAVPFGTALLSLSAAHDPVLFAPDLAGLNPDLASMQRSAAAFRPTLERMLRERHAVELLALYVDPAQDTFCTRPLAGIADLAGRRVRVGTGSQADFVLALGGVPVQTAFGEIGAGFRNASIDCAITGTLSGNTIGLHELTSHLHTMPLGWGLAAFVANTGAWNALPRELASLLRRELPRLEQAIWAESDRQSGEGIACNTGAAACIDGRKGSMTALAVTPADERKRREVLAGHVLPRWIQRCGPDCASVWAQTLAPVTGIVLR